ncbi:MAG: HDIG domain-containing protein [archaeon]|nr:HDIG domain-containing protein [archaeon]
MNQVGKMNKMNKMKIPSLEECNSIIEEYKVPEHIKSHIAMVRKIANFLAKKISKTEKEINLDLVDKGALLHDVMKMYCVENNCRHTEEASKVLSQKGFPEFGKVLEQHGLDEVNQFDAKTLLEAKIVWYADKRVNHDKLVSLIARYVYLKNKYGSESDKKMKQIISTEENAKKIEKEIFELAGLKRDILEDDLNG